MVRLPVPGSDTGSWARLLNDYLLVAHDEGGTFRAGSVDTETLRDRVVGLRHLRTVGASDPSIPHPVLSHNGRELVWESLQTTTPPMRINVADYGAKGDGVTDDTNAIQAAINAARGGGSVEFPRGIYMVRGLKISNKGTALIGEARWGTRLMRLSGNAPLIDLSGTATGIGHLRYCSIINLMLNGNYQSGPLVRSYYADNLVFRDVNFIHCAGVATDFVEVWDSRFESCAWEDCGSTSEPAALLRNSMPPGNFGYSTDNTNQIHFIACRWEGFRNGAIRLHGAANGSASKLNGIFFVACKMETSVAAGPAFQILAGSTVIYVTQLYMAIMAFDAGYTTPIDAISDSASHTFMSNVYVQWGPTINLANSVAHIAHAGPHMYHELSSFYPITDPAAATIVADGGSHAMVACLWANRGVLVAGDVSEMMETSAHMGLDLPLHHPASFRIMDHASDKDLLKVDSNPDRPALHLLNGLDNIGFAGNYTAETWRLIGRTGAARFAKGKFQIEGNKGYLGITATPYNNIAMLVRPAADSDRGLALVRASSTATGRLLEFQDETYNIQGQAFDASGRPVAVGTPARVTPGSQASYANPRGQVRDIAGGVTAAVRPSPTAPGPIASITFSRPYSSVPVAITLDDHSAIVGDLYISTRSETGFTVSTRSALRGGIMLNFDYTVTA